MTSKKINLVAADMGYGHQRAAYPLMRLSAGEIITINNYKGIPEWEKKYWLNSLRAYERLSRLKKIPLLGNLIFAVMDVFQKIQPLYPYRDLSESTAQQKFFFRIIKKGLGKHLIEKLNSSGLPYVTTFFVAAHIAEYHNYQGDIYCIICDSDASRAWAPRNPRNSRIKFLVPSEKVRERFLMYGVRPENIIITGFPLPLENVGIHKEIIKTDLARRVKALDPHGSYQKHYEALLKETAPSSATKIKQPLTITYAVGGAGAQAEIGILILRQLLIDIKNKRISLNLVAGNRPEIKVYFEKEISSLGLKTGEGVKVIFASDKVAYFKKFNLCLRTTDILWTKPSELSFSCALGLPIIMSTPVGSQEDFNRDWLLSVGAGVDSLDPKYTSQWLSDLLMSGRLARAAMDGFLNAEQLGAYNIEKLITTK
ncbi:MAG: hypothetical protein WC249_00065 [Patescibacteria group bacterium]|jgi:hypothetical protein